MLGPASAEVDEAALWQAAVDARTAGSGGTTGKDCGCVVVVGGRVVAWGANRPLLPPADEPPAKPRQEPHTRASRRGGWQHTKNGVAATQASPTPAGLGAAPGTPALAAVGDGAQSPGDPTPAPGAGSDFRADIEDWATGRLVRYDSDPHARLAADARHGGRAGYAATLRARCEQMLARARPSVRRPRPPPQSAGRRTPTANSVARGGTLSGFHRPKMLATLGPAPRQPRPLRAESCVSSDNATKSFDAPACVPQPRATARREL
jgi:hypothetical protein